VLENEITVLRFSEVGGGRLLGTDPYAQFWAKSGGWAFTRYWADTRYFTVIVHVCTVYLSARIIGEQQHTHTFTNTLALTHTHSHTHSIAGTQTLKKYIWRTEEARVHVQESNK